MNSTEWLTKLISFDTTSQKSNLPLIHAIRDNLAQYPSILSRLTYDTSEQKANLFATLPAFDGNTTKGGLVLSGHTDVVPVNGQKWDTDPFNAKVTPDRIYGRGACDMKGFIAVVLSLVPEFITLSLKKPLHLAFSYDEEVGGHGAKVLISDLKKNQIAPGACIVGEPTNMDRVIAHKGITHYRCVFKGRAAHSSLTPQGCNAIEYASQLISWIRELADQFKQQGPHDEQYDVSFSTLTTNLIQGGLAGNIIPETCEFTFELRNLPQVNPEEVLSKVRQYIHAELLPKMQKEHPQAAIELIPTCSLPGFITHEHSHFNKLVENLTQNKSSQKVSYATEAGIFQQAGIPTLICGPGSIEQAHRANEFVLLEQMRLCEGFLRSLVLDFGSI